MDLAELAYKETRAALTTTLENGGGEFDLMGALIQCLTFNRSDAVLAACIDEILELEQDCGGIPARRGMTLEQRQQLMAGFNARGLHARLER